MLLEPFQSDIECIEKMAEFLLRQRGQQSKMWGEDFEDRWRPNGVASVWASADIGMTLVAVNALSEMSSALKGNIQVTLRECADEMIALRKLIKEYTEKQRNRDIGALGQTESATEIHGLLEEICRETQGYVGWPRSYAGQLGSLKKPKWGTANLIATCTAIRFLAFQNKNHEHEFIAPLFKHLCRPELSLLRQALDTIAPEALEKTNAYLPKLKKAFQDGLPARFKDAGSAFLCVESKRNDRDTSNALADYCRKELTEGALWVKDEEAGWMAAPFQTGSGLSVEAILYGLEVLAKHATDQDIQRAFEPALATLEKKLLSQLFSEKGKTLDDIKKLSDYPERVPLGLWVRSVLSLCAIQETLPTASAFMSRVIQLRDIAYSGLLVRAFGLLMDKRMPPHEPVPVAYAAGNEIAHWPGVDVGLVTLALLRGREKVNFANLCKDYRVLQSLKDALWKEEWLEPSGNLPITLPLFRTLINEVKLRVISHHNSKIVAESFSLRGFNKVTHDEVVGGFLASTSIGVGHDSTPTIYLWSTAHALSALVEWHTQQSAEIKKRDAKIAELTDASSKQVAPKHHLAFLANKPVYRASYISVAALVAVSASYAYTWIPVANPHTPRERFLLTGIGILALVCLTLLIRLAQARFLNLGKTKSCIREKLSRFFMVLNWGAQAVMGAAGLDLLWWCCKHEHLPYTKEALLAVGIIGVLGGLVKQFAEQSPVWLSIKLHWNLLDVSADVDWNKWLNNLVPTTPDEKSH